MFRNQAKRNSAFIVAVIWVAACIPTAAAEQLTPETTAGFEHYVELSEQRMSQEANSGPFLRVDGLPQPQRDLDYQQLKTGEVITDHLQTLDHGAPVPVPHGLIHHWIGTIFIPSATLAQTLAFLEDYDDQSKFYAPEVQRSKLVQQHGNQFKVFLRLEKKKIITVILNTNYDVKYTLLGPDRAASDSHSIHIAEVENPGKPNESEKPVGNDSGFLWRLNSYWRFLQRDGGTYVQLEAISLTRDIPTGLNWLVNPFVTSIPKGSLVFTLSRTREALAGK
jgi:hypothetical protein